MQPIYEIYIWNENAKNVPQGSVMPQILFYIFLVPHKKNNLYYLLMQNIFYKGGLEDRIYSLYSNIKSSYLWKVPGNPACVCVWRKEKYMLSP